MPATFRLRTVVIEPGETVAFDAHEWHDCLVILEAGRLGVECTSGSQRSFRAGAVLAFAGLAVRVLRCEGEESVVLTSLRRKSCPGR